MKKIKVVIIDDEIEYLNDLAMGLEILGYEASKAASGSHAIEVIARDRPDIILCDYKLDDMDGTEVIAKAEKINPGGIYIMVTAYYDESFDDIFRKAGADEIVYKPIQLAELDRLIRKRIDGQIREDKG